MLDDAVKVLIQYASIIGNPTVATGLDSSVFIPILEKGNVKECSNYHIIVIISHASKAMLKSLKLGFNCM